MCEHSEKQNSLPEAMLLNFGFWFNIPVNSYGHFETVN